MVTVFISYATQDVKEAGALHHLLKLLGFKCFLAHKDIPKGEQWRDEIVNVLRKSDVFIALLSEHGVASSWVQQECGMAHLLRKRARKPLIIPVVPDGAVPPGCLSDYQAQTISLTFWFSKLNLTTEIAKKLALAIVAKLRCADAIKPQALDNAKSLKVEDLAFVIDALSACGNTTFSDFLTLTNAAISHIAAARSDAVMTALYQLLEVHRAELSKWPEWVRAWNGLHKKYSDFKEVQRQQQEEMLRNLRESMKPKADSSKSS